MTDSSCRARGRFRPCARLNQPFLGAATSPPWPVSRHVFTSSTCSRLLLANRNRFSSLGSVRENRYSVRRDRFVASASQVPSVDFCNTHRRADTPYEHSILVRTRDRGLWVRFTIGMPMMVTSLRHARLSPAPRGPGVLEPRPRTKRAPLLETSPEHPGRRATTQDGVETPSSQSETAEIHFRRRPAKGNGFRRIKVLSTELESTRATWALGKDRPRARWTAPLSRRPSLS